MSVISSILKGRTFRDNRERPAHTFEAELHFQSKRFFLIPSSLSFLWLFFIPIDQQMYPDMPILIWIRVGLCVVGLTLIIIHLLKWAEGKQQALLMVIASYLAFGSATIVGLTACDPVYLTGFILIISIVPLLPVNRGRAYFLLITSIVYCIILSLMNGFDPSNPDAHYSLNDLIAGLIIFSTLTWVQHSYRYRIWQNSVTAHSTTDIKLEAAKEKVEAKSRFLATMSHEIRTPMNGVIGMAEMLKNTELAPNQRQYVDIINNSGKALLNIISDILDYSKIEAGKLDIESVDIDIDALCLDVVSLFSLTADKKGIELITNILPGTPLYIKSDPTRLRQILLNLLGNAFKFTSEGKIIICIEPAIDIEETGNTIIKFSIKDTGIGLSQTQCKQLFAAFSQADSTTTRKYGGTGLGLSISKSLAELMGGKIGVTSELNEGSTFWFEISCQLASTSFIKQNQILLNNLNRKRILIVDDSVEFTQVIAEQCKSWGMVVDTAYTVEQAKRKFILSGQIHFPYDVAALDMTLPDGSGLELSQWMMQSESLNKVRRVLITGLSLTPAKKEIVEANISNVIQKPIAARSLKNNLLHVFDERSDEVLEDDEKKQNKILSGKTALVAEDNSVNMMVIRSMLKKLNMKCIIAEDGEVALNHYLASHASIDLILMDFEMPKMDGLESTFEVRTFEQRRQLDAVPIIGLTAHAMNEHREQGLRAGMNDHMTKPIELKVLKQTIIKHLSKSA